MIAKYVQTGEALDYTNSTDARIPANSVVLIGKHIGIAAGDIEPGALGALHVAGVFEIQKKAGVALTMGQGITYTDADGIDAADTDAMGYAVADAGADDPAAAVKLIG